MRPFNADMRTRAPWFVSLAACGMIAVAALPGKAWSQGGTTPPQSAESVTQSAMADSIIEACYVTTTGVVYLLKEPGLKAQCATQRHVPFSWRTSGGAPGPIGPQGPAGATGPVGPAGSVGPAGAAGATGAAGANGADGATGPQ